mmetsp:Transcript_20882/g.27462  ORF Transcript_20882/g.27462 Transcript_20882/m.27462 type:complete len:203 (-) Transcript_20882:566-1174(-)
MCKTAHDKLCFLARKFAPVLVCAPCKLQIHKNPLSKIPIVLKLCQAFLGCILLEVLRWPALFLLPMFSWIFSLFEVLFLLFHLLSYFWRYGITLRRSFSKLLRWLSFHLPVKIIWPPFKVPGRLPIDLSIQLVWSLSPFPSFTLPSPIKIIWSTFKAPGRFPITLTIQLFWSLSPFPSLTLLSHHFFPFIHPFDPLLFTHCF